MNLTISVNVINYLFENAKDSSRDPAPHQYLKPSTASLIRFWRDFLINSLSMFVCFCELLGKGNRDVASLYAHWNITFCMFSTILPNVKPLISGRREGLSQQGLKSICIATIQISNPSPREITSRLARTCLSPYILKGRV